jgi:hypothetical protein
MFRIVNVNMDAGETEIQSEKLRRLCTPGISMVYEYDGEKAWCFVRLNRPSKLRHRVVPPKKGHFVFVVLFWLTEYCVSGICGTFTKVIFRPMVHNSGTKNGEI